MTPRPGPVFVSTFGYWLWEAAGLRRVDLGRKPRDTMNSRSIRECSIRRHPAYHRASAARRQRPGHDQRRQLRLEPQPGLARFRLQEQPAARRGLLPRQRHPGQRGNPWAPGVRRPPGLAQVRGAVRERLDRAHQTPQPDYRHGNDQPAGRSDLGYRLPGITITPNDIALDEFLALRIFFDL